MQIYCENNYRRALAAHCPQRHPEPAGSGRPTDKNMCGRLLCSNNVRWGAWLDRVQAFRTPRPCTKVSASRKARRQGTPSLGKRRVPPVRGNCATRANSKNPRCSRKNNGGPTLQVLVCGSRTGSCPQERQTNLNQPGVGIRSRVPSAQKEKHHRALCGESAQAPSALRVLHLARPPVRLGAFLVLTFLPQPSGSPGSAASP